MSTDTLVTRVVARCGMLVLSSALYGMSADSAFSSQDCIRMSRNIVTAILQCSSASRLFPAPRASCPDP